MKKIFFLFLAILIFTGCAGQTKYQINEKTAPESLENYDEAGVMKRINEIQQGQADKNAQSTITNTNNKTQANAQNRVELENLASNIMEATIKTNLGDITVEFYPEESPITVNNFLNLAKKGFFDGTRFHRVIKNFMIQGGDPQSKDLANKDMWGTGGPGYKFQDEFNDYPLQRGSLAMANSGPNTNGSQFFIVTAEFTPWLAGKHTNFGQVTRGMDVVDKIEAEETDGRDRPVEDVIIESIELIEK